MLVLKNVLLNNRKGQNVFHLRFLLFFLCLSHFRYSQHHTKLQIVSKICPKTLHSIMQIWWLSCVIHAINLNFRMCQSVRLLMEAWFDFRSDIARNIFNILWLMPCVNVVKDLCNKKEFKSISSIDQYWKSFIMKWNLLLSSSSESSDNLPDNFVASSYWNIINL